MLNRETAFADLARPENISKINIDPALVPQFVCVLGKIQDYFSRKGYMNANNYAMYIEKHFFSKEWSIVFGETGKNDAQTSVIKKTITISNRKKQDSSLLDQIICHEFIHFLVMADLPFIEQKDGTFLQDKNRVVMDHFSRGGFFNEAYTQLLTNKIIPVSNNYYLDFVKMIEFANYVMRTEDNLFAFLRGQIPALKYFNSFSLDFIRSAERYFVSTYDKKRDSKINLDYRNACTQLLYLFMLESKNEINRFEFESVKDFVYRMKDFVTLLPVQNEDAYKILKQINNKFLRVYFPNAKDKQRSIIAHDLLVSESHAYDISNQIIEEYQINSSFCDGCLSVRKNEFGFEFTNKEDEFEFVFTMDKTKIDKLKFEVVAKNPFTIEIFVNEDKLNVVFSNDEMSEKYSFDVNSKRINTILKKNKQEQKELLEKLEKQIDMKRVTVGKILKIDPTISQLIRVNDSKSPELAFYIAKYMNNHYSLVVVDDKIHRTEPQKKPCFNLEFANGTKKIVNLKSHISDATTQDVRIDVAYKGSQLYINSYKSKRDLKQFFSTPTEKEF